MNYRQVLKSHGYDDEAIDAFLAYHALHKWCWARFESAAMELIAQGRKRIGAKQIVEHIRYTAPAEAVRAGLRWKVNNNYTAMYARIFCAKHPKMRQFLELREVKGLRAPQQTALELRGQA